MEVFEVYEVTEIWLVVEDFQPLQKVWGFRLPMLVFSPNIKDKYVSKGAPSIPQGFFVSRKARKGAKTQRHKYFYKTKLLLNGRHFQPFELIDPS